MAWPRASCCAASARTRIGSCHGPGLHRLAQGEHPQRVTLVVRSLGLLQQHIALHGGIARFLNPLGRAVTPVPSLRGIARVTVEPPRELGTTGADSDELSANVRLDVPCALANRTQDAEHHRQRLDGAKPAVVGLTGVELATEVVDDRAIEVAASIAHGKGNVVRLIQPEGRQSGDRQAAAEQ
jgi:hypothetical protein